MQFTVEILRVNQDDDGGGIAIGEEGSDHADADVELHESLAPLYYLYGSTLLYSVEESDVMMASSGGQRSDNGAPQDFIVDAEEDGGEEQDEPEMMNKNDYEGGGGGAQDHEQHPPGPPQSDATEDLQIAWENLETARSIVTKMVRSFHHSSFFSSAGGKSEYDSNNAGGKNAAVAIAYSRDEKSELLLDLAQIHTRLGDLQRGNNSVTNITDCITDYTTALKLRLEVLGKYDKKVADSHYSLAGVYAEAPSKSCSGEEEEEEMAVERFMSQFGVGGGGGGGERHTMTETEKMEYRERSMEHYVQCAVSFSGMLAIMCGEDADSLTEMNNETTAAPTAAAAVKNVGGGGIHSTILSTLRSRVSNLTPPTKSPEKESFEDIKEILDEIQEAVDTAEEAEEGLRTLGAMKANEIRKHEAKMNGEQGDEFEEEEGEGRTTIGFGSSAAASLAAAAASGVNVFGATSATAVASSVNAFSSTAAATTTSAQQMMMVVKKKKKVQPVLLDTDSAKRSKTE